MHFDNVLSDEEVFIVVLFIKDDEEDIESGHDWWGNVHVESE